MRHVYSRTGCIPCKRRKKKCGEERPLCATCVRLNIRCSYNPEDPSIAHPQGAVTIGTFEVPSGSPVTRNPEILSFGNGMGSVILRQAPSILESFWSLACSKETRDGLSTMWQLTFQNDMVRNSVIACFSGFFPPNNQTFQAKHLALSKALPLLQINLERNTRARSDAIPIQLAIMFIGLMESVKPDALASLLDHWQGAMMHAKHVHAMGILDWRYLPCKEYLLCYESLLYHIGTLAIHVPNVKRVHSLWKTSRIQSYLEQLNPPGPQRIYASMLLSGQYIVFEMALDVAYYFRIFTQNHVDPRIVEQMELLVSRKLVSLDHEFDLLTNSRTRTTGNSLLCQTYRLFCKVLQVCLLTFRTPSFEQIRQVDDLVLECLHDVENLLQPTQSDQSTPFANIMWICVWPLQVLACAIRRRKDLQKLIDLFATKKMFIDVGNRERTEILHRRMEDLTEGTSQDSYSDVHRTFYDELPRGFSLLRDPRGVLH